MAAGAHTLGFEARLAGSGRSDVRSDLLHRGDRRIAGAFGVVMVRNPFYCVLALV